MKWIISDLRARSDELILAGKLQLIKEIAENEA